MKFLNDPEWNYSNEQTTCAVDTNTQQDVYGSKTLWGPQTILGERHYRDVGNANFDFGLFGQISVADGRANLFQTSVCWNYEFSPLPEYFLPVGNARGLRFSMSFNRPVFPTQSALPTYTFAENISAHLRAGGFTSSPPSGGADWFGGAYPAASYDYAEIDNDKTNNTQNSACFLRGVGPNGASLVACYERPGNTNKIANVEFNPQTIFSVTYKGMGFAPPPDTADNDLSYSYITTIYQEGNAASGNFGQLDVVVMDVLTPQPLISTWSQNENVSDWVDKYSMGAYNRLVDYLSQNSYVSPTLSLYQPVIRGYVGKMPNNSAPSLQEVQEIVGIYLKDNDGIYWFNFINGGAYNEGPLLKDGSVCFVSRDKHFVFKS